MERKIGDKIRCRKRYLDWKKKILERDNFACKKCGLQGAVEVHHKKEFSTIIEECQIKTFEQALLNEELWDEANAITLCQFCHKEEHGQC